MEKELKTSDELQELVVSSLLNNSYLFSKVSNRIDESFFSNYLIKVIYRSLYSYYREYSKLPSMKELRILVVQNNRSEYVSNQELLEKLEDLHKLDYEENFVLDQLSKFFRKEKFSKALESYSEDYKTKSPDKALDNLMNTLKDDTELTFPRSSAIRLSDSSKLEDIRLEAVGSEANPIVIKSCYNTINKSLMYKGYRPGEVNLIVASPGCLVGHTKVKLENGSWVTLSDLYNSKNKVNILGYDLVTKKVIPQSYKEVVLTKYVKEVVKLKFPNRTLTCTLDHKFLTDSGYIEAQCITPSDKIINDSGSTQSCIPLICEMQEEIPVFDIVGTDCGNFIVRSGRGSGIIAHNSGKTMFLVNEGVNAAKQGFKVLHLYLGDMVEYDGFIRYLSNYTGIDQDKIAVMPVNEQADLIKTYNLDGVLSRIVVSSYPAQELSIDEMIQEVKKLQSEFDTHFDVILVDYAENLKRESESMYDSGGIVYDKLSNLARKNCSCILAASQISKNYWGNEIIPLEAAAESSKKQHAADMVISLGSYSKTSSYGSLFISKVRRGDNNVLIRVRKDYEKARLVEVPESEYAANKEKSKEELKMMNKSTKELIREQFKSKKEG